MTGKSIMSRRSGVSGRSSAKNEDNFDDMDIFALENRLEQAELELKDAEHAFVKAHKIEYPPSS